MSNNGSRSSSGKFICLLKEGFSIDLRSLALMRIAVALTLLYDISQRLSDHELFIVDGSLFSIELARSQAKGIFQLYLLSGSHGYQLGLVVLTGVLSLFLLLGYRARFIAAGLWVLQLSLQLRHPLSLTVGDYFVTIWLFWLALTPCDSRLCLFQKTRAHGPHQVFHPACAALIVQYLFIYLFACFFKLQNELWVNGKALQVVFSDGNWTRDLGRAIASSEIATHALTHATLVTEGLLPLLLVIPLKNPWWRFFAVIALVFFQLVLGAGISLGHIPYAMISATLLFLPSCFWQRFTGKAENGEHSGLESKYGLSIYPLGLLMICLFAMNIKTLTGLSLLPHRVRTFIESMGMKQHWGMYAQTPTGVGRIVLSIAHDDGKESHVAIGPADKPKLPNLTPLPFADTLWQSFRGRAHLYDGMTSSDREVEWEDFLRVILKYYRKEFPKQRIQSISVYTYRDKSEPKLWFTLKL